MEATLFTVAMLVCETEHAHVFAGKCVSDTLRKDFVNAQRCDSVFFAPQHPVILSNRKHVYCSLLIVNL